MCAINVLSIGIRLVAVLAALAIPIPSVAADLREGTKEVILQNGTVVRVEAGELRVPESRRRPSERQVTIPYYRLRSDSDAPAAPIFLLAGGPGGSWINQFRNDENYREVTFIAGLLTSCCSTNAAPATRAP
jgi:hypothetical protein